jgi:hypothetical protein
MEAISFSLFFWKQPSLKSDRNAVKGDMPMVVTVLSNPRSHNETQSHISTPLSHLYSAKLAVML